MNKVIIILLIIHSARLLIAQSSYGIIAQNTPATAELQLENLISADQAETEDDTYLQQLEQYSKNPLNLNTADAAELKELGIVTDLQIDNLIAYRKLLGQLVSVYELQAVPSWDLLTIRRLLPYITVSTGTPITKSLTQRFKDGDHQFLFRVSQVLERSAGFDGVLGDRPYPGSRQQLFFRYRYKYKNLLQYGVTGDKDAGERFFKGAQNKGFDFYSFHLFARKLGMIQSLAIGDFTVNMGQGLIQWQGMATGKSANITAARRSLPILRPYNSGGEFYFNRGVGVSIKKAGIETTLFASSRAISANLVTDTTSGESFVTSFLPSGYHRTQNENDERNNLQQISFGGNILYRADRLQIGVNGIYHRFSFPLQKKMEPYNLFAIRGNRWYNYSVDYSYTYRNIHLFGEIAADMHFNKAFINGLLLSVDRGVDIAVVQRSIQPAYQVIYGNAFTENSSPGNETGFYTGISMRPANHWRCEAYTDIYKFPWLKSGMDAPGGGTDWLIQLTYTAGKQTEIYTKFRNEAKSINQSDHTGTMNRIRKIPRKNWRTHIHYAINPALTLRSRVDLTWYDHKGKHHENGFLLYMDIMCKPLLKPFSGIMRLQYFESDGYNSRLYAYENDVLYNYSIPTFFDTGYRYYLVLSYNLGKKISCWFRYAQTIYRDKTSLGSGSDKIDGHTRTEIKLQMVYQL